MKKLIFTLSTLTLMATAANAQYCGGSATSVCTPRPATDTAGLTPTPQDLPCIVRGVAVDQVIFFEFFKSYNLNGTNLTINSFKLDSIGNLPAGLCWKTNKANNTFAGGEVGCIRVTGTTTDPSGQYKLKIIATVATPLVTLSKQDAETLASLRYYVRVNCSGVTCPDVDTTTGKTTPFISYNQTCTVGLEEASKDFNSLTVVPNPFSSSSTLSFVAEKDENYTVTITNIIGAVVATKNVAATVGPNEVKIERNGLAAGVYIVNLSNGKATEPRRIVIQ